MATNAKDKTMKIKQTNWKMMVMDLDKKTMIIVTRHEEEKHELRMEPRTSTQNCIGKTNQKKEDV